MVSWSRVIWWWSLAVPMGVVVAGGCGGRVLQAECKPGWQFCKEAVVCCPDYMVCGTGQPNADGYTCALGACCPPFDAGDEAGAGEDAPWWDEYDADYSGSGSLPGNGGGGGGSSSSGGVHRQM